MKPKEFDELIRQKFDRNDFEYNAQNWERLAEQLDGRAKKRSIAMIWWMPLVGVAASVAIAFGVTSMLKQDVPGNTNANTEIAQTKVFVQPQAPVEVAIAHENKAPHHKPYIKSAKNNHKPAAKQNDKNTADWFAINYQNAIGNAAKPSKPSNLINNKDVINKKKTVHSNEAIITFRPEADMNKVPKTSIVLSGGINRGNQNNGYIAGATIRRMVNDKLYIEGDVAFASSTNTQSTQYLFTDAPAASHMAGKPGVAAKSTGGESSKPAVSAPIGIIKEKEVSYNSCYAQVTPTIGYKLIKRMSVGVGPDFQQMLVDNRPDPDPSNVDRGTIQVAPKFDVGFMGKSEFALTKKFLAAVYYRKGINNVITPMGKYIDRDYMQFQLKYTIFNK